MTIGDKVIVTYANGDQLVGLIIGETEKMWEIDFDGDEKTRKVRKSMDIELVDDVVEEEVVEEVVEPEEEVVEEVVEPTEEEFAEPVGEPKTKKVLVVLATVVLVAIAGLIALRVFGVL